MSAYADFPKKNFLYKTRLAKKNGVTRYDSAILIPKDRPQPVAVDGIGQKIAENYWSKSEDRWIVRLSGPLPARPAVAVVTYKGGGKESFNIKSLASRTEYAPGPWKGSTSEPATPPAQPSAPSPGPGGGSITFPASYAGRVAFVALVGAKGEVCQPDRSSPGRWMHKRTAAPADFYAIRWAVQPPAYVKAYNLGPVGLWSYFDDGDFKEWPNAQVPVAPKPPAPIPATPSPVPTKDATLTATGLRLAPDLVPLVAKVLVLTHAETPSNTVKYQAIRQGDEWTTGSGLQTYPGAVYQVFWSKEPPARIPHHQGFPGAIKNVSHVMPDGRWNPPTTRNP